MAGPVACAPSRLRKLRRLFRAATCRGMLHSRVGRQGGLLAALWKASGGTATVAAAEWQHGGSPVAASRQQRQQQSGSGVVAARAAAHVGRFRSRLSVPLVPSHRLRKSTTPCRRAQGSPARRQEGPQVKQHSKK